MREERANGAGWIGGAAAAALAMAALLWNALPPGSGVDAGESAAFREQTNALRAEISSLSDALEDERVARERLEAEVAILRSVVELEAGRSAAEGAAGDGPDEEALARGPAPRGPSGPGEEGGFDVGALVELGVTEADATRLRERWETKQLDRLYLADRATREGWLGSTRFRDQAQRIDDALRDDVGDDSWDQMLFAAGYNNRVVVSNVLEGSQAASLGIRSGDEILSYGGSRVFGAAELREATRGGESGDVVRIEILRDGEPLGFWLPRGPIGVQIDPDRRPPGSS